MVELFSQHGTDNECFVQSRGVVGFGESGVGCDNHIFLINGRRVGLLTAKSESSAAIGSPQSVDCTIFALARSRLSCQAPSGFFLL